MHYLVVLLSYDDVELGVDVDELALLVDDGEGGDPLGDELVERVDDRRLVGRHLDPVVGPDVEVADGGVKVFRFRQVVYLEEK